MTFRVRVATWLGNQDKAAELSHGESERVSPSRSFSLYRDSCWGWPRMSLDDGGAVTSTRASDYEKPVDENRPSHPAASTSSKQKERIDACRRPYQSSFELCTLLAMPFGR